jgi:hypothetical protein
MKVRRSTGLAAGLTTLVLTGPAYAAGPAVNVRVEGENATLLPRTGVTLSGAAVPGSSGCGPASAGAAIDQATHGNWDRSPFVTTLLGESHDFSRSDYWAEWIDTGTGYKRGNGICTDQLAAGDEVLMLVDMPPYGEGSTTEVPLAVRGVPARVTAGSTVTVTVVGAVTTSQYGDPGDGVDTPVSGATVTGGGTSAVTDAAGHASLRLDALGAATLRAAKAGDVPSAAQALEVVAPGTPVPPCATTGHDGRCGTADTTAPVARLRKVYDDWYYSRRHAPRTLRGTVTADPSGIKQVEIRFKRRRGAHCASYSAAKERWVSRSCKRNASWFGVGDRQAWSYLLPARLRAGRYTLDVRATDNAGNRSVLRRGRSRVVFRVL